MPCHRKYDLPIAKYAWHTMGRLGVIPTKYDFPVFGLAAFSMS